VDQHESPLATTPADEVARRLNKLFADIKRPDRRKHTDEELAEHVRQVTGKSCSRYWIGQLRAGKIGKPDLGRLAAIADFFDVSPAYFHDDAYAEGVAEDLETAAALKELEAHGVHLRELVQLDPADLGFIRNMIERLAEAKRQRQPPPAE
jgi:transcriptional regulator with XRE-family HTH domain